MDHVRISTVVLTCVSVLALAACGGEEPAPTAAPTSAAATTAAAAPTAATPAAADPVSDKKLCETAKKIGDDSKKALMKAIVDGGDPAAAMKKAYTEMAEGATPAAGGSGSEVAAALAAFGAEAGKIANAADVEAAAEDSAALEKAGAKANAACKKVGVDPNL
ncbi:hypothetical protein [Micromonospora haikouensis]|uniref:hypothetical protein n=1 Tax=Micromonospora haikouensis TaxID=686309 RepID=UPI003D8A53FF